MFPTLFWGVTFLLREYCRSVNWGLGMTNEGLEAIGDYYAETVEDQGVDLGRQHDRAFQTGAYEV